MSLASEVCEAVPLGDALEILGLGPIRRGHFVCPLHEDNHPSAWAPGGDKGWYCFPCGKGGDVVTLAKLTLGVRGHEAAVYLAERAGIPVPDGPPRCPRVGRFEYQAVKAAAMSLLPPGNPVSAWRREALLAEWRAKCWAFKEHRAPLHRRVAWMERWSKRARKELLALHPVPLPGRKTAPVLISGPGDAIFMVGIARRARWTGEAGRWNA